MDVCCLGRPFDDLSQDQINLEAEAVLSILSRCEEGEWTLVASGVIEYEISNIPDESIREQVQALYVAATERLISTDEAEARAVYFHSEGIRPFDSLHLAMAEINNVDVFLTTDKRLLRAAKRLNAKVETYNPVTWLMEVLSDEK